MFVATYFRISIAVLVLLWTGLPITAQDPNNGTPTEATPNPGEPPKEAQPNEKKEESKEDPPPKVIRRDEVKSTDKPAEPLTAQVDSDGKVSFQFRDQGWVELVQWLADISDQPIDWLELPGDKVNLRSPGKYTVVETQDLFNRHLLARGYTLLDVDGGLTIVRTKTINPSIIQRVDEAELKGLPDYTFVRSTLDAGWLSATKLAEEFKPMLSSGGVLTPLATTNQIEAMDAAINLREIAHLIATQRSQTTLETLAPEFKLRYLPAEKAKTMLEEFLGISKQDTPPLTPEQIQMMQQQGGQQGMPALTPKTPEISVVANIRQNSLLIRAPVDRIAISMEFLKRVDVASNSMASLADIKTNVQVFRLSSLDSEKLIEIVSEMNILEPDTRIRSDKENQAVIVSGSAADRYIIENLIQRLDGSGRTFEVLPLRRLDPTAVAESIAFLMGHADDKDEKKNSRRSYYWGYNDDNDEEKKKEDKFRVSANAPGRQIMLWANEQEMEQVRSLLVKLGELPPPGGNSQTTRIIDASATPETLLYLQRLKEQWQQIAKNELELPSEDQFANPNEKQDEAVEKKSSDNATDESEAKEKDARDKDAKVKASNVDPADAAHTWPQSIDSKSTTPMTLVNQLVPEGQESSDNDALPFDKDKIRSSQDFDRVFGTGKKTEPSPAGSDGTEPITVQIDPDGNLILSSNDTVALDRLENLMLQIAPPKRAYRVFRMKHASAFWMKTNLEDYFKDNADDGDSDADNFFSWYWGDDDNDDEKKEPTGLGKGNKLKFVDDVDTNTLVVSGATSSQLKTIAELIELWDVDEPVNKQRARFTELTTIKYGKAETIVETVKEAYRDLLSSNDKTFQAGGAGAEGAAESKPKKNKDGSEGSSFASGDRDGGATDFAFKGKLSMGIDPIGNTILVSAEGQSLLGLVVDMIKQLDEAAAPKGEVEVIEVSGKINEKALQDALKMMGKTSGSLSSDTSDSDNDSRGDRSERFRSRDR
jgi:type II secretory pathway component GspD/PulD (secretin)